MLDSGFWGRSGSGLSGMLGCTLGDQCAGLWLGSWFRLCKDQGCEKIAGK